MKSRNANAAEPFRDADNYCFPNTPKPEPGATFTLTVRARPGVAPIPALRALLKRLLRQHGFRCLDLREWRRP